MRPVALLTDFGLRDPYAGQLRAAMARNAPGAAILDITHHVEPFAVDQAAFFLAASARHFPPNAVFVCVVDPGVGTTRRIIGARIAGQDFLAPDNGLLGLLFSEPDCEKPELYDLSRAAAAYASSATFHGRDIFAPLAGRLCAEGTLAEMGDPLDLTELSRPDWTQAAPSASGVEARVLHVDRYGNCLLSLRPSQASEHPVGGVRMSWGQRRGLRQVRTYGDLIPGEVGLLTGSQGFLELAVNQASAAEVLGLRRGDALRLLWETAP